MAGVDEDELVIADIPGLIEGAHEGAGLGTRFLGHVERCGVLLHLVDGTAEDVAQSYKIIRGELESYGGGLRDKTEIVALNKCDALTEEEIAKKLLILNKVSGAKALRLSSVAGLGVEKTLRFMNAVNCEDKADKVIEDRLVIEP